MSDSNNIPEPGRGRSSASRMASLMRRAESLVERGQLEEAVASLQEAIAICPQDPKCSVRLANIYRAQNRMGLAIDAMHRAVELDPHNAGMQQLLLCTLIELGKYDEAVHASKQLLKKSPKNILARDVLGIAYLQQGRLDQALKVTDELIRLAPTDAANHFKKAVLLQQKGEIAPAMVLFILALEMDPNSDVADDAREAIAALDSYQLRQILTVAVEDTVFRTKLMIDPDSTLQERGFRLSSSGIATLRQIDLNDLPGDSKARYYH